MAFFKTQNKFCNTDGSYWMTTPYEQETYDLLSRMIVNPATGLKRLINITIKKLKDADIWNYLDCYQSYNLHTQQASLLNWKQDKYNASIVNSPTWSKYTGFTGDSLTNYINTGFNPYDTSALFSRNDALFGIVVTGTDVDYAGHGARISIGNYNSWIARSSFNFFYGLNSNHGNVSGNYFNNNIILERDNSINFNLYVNKTKSVKTISSTPILDYNFYALAENNTGVPENLSSETAKQFFTGSYLGASKVEELQDIINSFNYSIAILRY